MVFESGAKLPSPPHNHPALRRDYLRTEQGSTLGLHPRFYDKAGIHNLEKIELFPHCRAAHNTVSHSDLTPPKVDYCNLEVCCKYQRNRTH